MSATILPELAAESVETADRLFRLSAGEGLDSAEAEYVLASGLAAIQRAAKLWPIVRKRIGAGMMGFKAQQLLARLLEVVDRNLALAGTMKEPARDKPQTVSALANAEDRLLEIRAEAARLLKVLDAPLCWPSAELLEEARERIRQGDLLSETEFRQALLGE